MKVFCAASQQVEILGDAIIPVLKSISSLKVLDKLLAKHGLDHVEKGRFYPQQHYLDLLRDVHDNMRMVLLKIGRNIFAEAVFPPHIDSFEKALLSMDTAYQMNHRGGEIGYYRAEKTGAGTYSMACHTPFPCSFDIGVIEGIAKFFDTRVIVEHSGDECRMSGGERCRYQIHQLKSAG